MRTHEYGHVYVESDSPYCLPEYQADAVQETLDALDDERTYFEGDAELHAQMVREEQENEVTDLVSFFEDASRPLFERDD